MSSCRSDLLADLELGWLSHSTAENRGKMISDTEMKKWDYFFSRWWESPEWTVRERQWQRYTGQSWWPIFLVQSCPDTENSENTCSPQYTSHTEDELPLLYTPHMCQSHHMNPEDTAAPEFGRITITSISYNNSNHTWSSVVIVMWSDPSSQPMSLTDITFWIVSTFIPVGLLISVVDTWYYGECLNF